MSLRIWTAFALGLVVFCSGMASAIDIRTLDETGKENGLWTLDCTWGASVETATLTKSEYRTISIPQFDSTGKHQTDTLLAGICPRTIDAEAYTASARTNVLEGSASVSEILYLTDFRTTSSFSKVGQFVTTCNYESNHPSGPKGFNMFAGNPDKKTCTIKPRSASQGL